MTIVKSGYIHRRKAKNVFRNWWLVKTRGSTQTEQITLGKVSLPKEYMGKKVRFKVEIMDEDEMKTQYDGVI